MSAARPIVLLVGPWPPTKGGVTTFMRNVVNSPLKEQYDFIPFTTSRPGKRNIKGDNYGYFAIFRGGLKRVAQGILITLRHLIIRYIPRYDLGCPTSHSESRDGPVQPHPSLARFFGVTSGRNDVPCRSRHCLSRKPKSKMPQNRR